MIRHHAITTDTLHLIANSDAVTKALAWLDHISNRELWSEALRFSLSISLDEALTNIVSHGLKNIPSMKRDSLTKNASTLPRISITCLIKPHKIQLEISDNGFRYDPTTSALPTLAESIEHANIGGLGLRLMHHYLSEISYFYRNKKNYLILSKLVDSATTN